MKQTDDVPSPTQTWRPVDKWTKCLQEFSDLDPGLVLGPLSQMTINYHQQVSSEERTQYSPSDICPRLPGKLRGGRQDLIRFSSSRRQLESRANYRWWWPGHDCVSCTPQDWLMPQTFHQAEAKHWAWERGRVTPVNRCQAASDLTCVTLIPRLVHRKLSSPVSGMSKLSLHDLWDLQWSSMYICKAKYLG